MGVARMLQSGWVGPTPFQAMCTCYKMGVPNPTAWEHQTMYTCYKMRGSDLNAAIVFYEICLS